MTELKDKFMKLAEISALDFSANHPGHHIAATLVEKMMRITDEEINAALEVEPSLSAAIMKIIFYEFTGGRNKNFKKPEWLRS